MDFSVLMGSFRHQLWFYVVLSALVGIIMALTLHRLGALLLLRLTQRRSVLVLLVQYAYTPGRWLLRVLFLQRVWESVPDDGYGIVRTREISRLILIAPVIWLIANCCTAIDEGVMRTNPVDGANNLRAWRIHTQTRLLVRCINLIVLLIGVAAMLMTFPAVRQIGASIMASAGLLGWVAGFAARPVLGDLIAGLQIAINYSAYRAG